MRQKRITEWVNDSCKGCNFLGKEVCQIPGGTCWKRRIDGVPGQFVKDILHNTGVIDRVWRKDCQRKKK